VKELNVLIVGAFPKPSNRVIFGGVVSSCRALVSSTLVENFNHNATLKFSAAFILFMACSYYIGLEYSLKAFSFVNIGLTILIFYIGFKVFGIKQIINDFRES
jgi:hypothetical protein